MSDLRSWLDDSEGSEWWADLEEAIEQADAAMFVAGEEDDPAWIEGGRP